MESAALPTLRGAMQMVTGPEKCKCKGVVSGGGAMLLFEYFILTAS